ncbi:MAG TPA: MBL fold metallo-hydrolase [Tepidisphaeraceae bacterium]|nr:MBL fold metallo-hydrolase [Tepidisphaeraceae bacterium]
MKKPLLQDHDLIAELEADAGSKQLRLWWLGQSGFLISWEPWRLLVDPYLSDSLTQKYATTDKPHVRVTERVIDPRLFREISFVTASHAHTDHLDAETLRGIRRSNDPTFIAPRAIRGVAEERWGPDSNPIVFMSDGESQIWGDVRIQAVPAAHNSLDRDADGNAMYLGYLVKLGPFTVYHSGDTKLYPGMADLLRPFNIDVALLPINGDRPERRVAGNLSGKEAAQLAKDIGAKLVIPCHYDMFEFNTADPADQFVPECERLDQRYRVLQQGERWSSDELAT